jgi:hypothetical protein
MVSMTCPAKGQTKSKWFFQANVSVKKRTNEFNFPTMRLIFVRFLEGIEDTKKTLEFEYWVLDGLPWPKMVGFCDLLGTLYSPVSKIPSVKVL